MPILNQTHREAQARAVSWRLFRKVNMLSQADLAREMAISRRTVAAIEAVAVLNPRPATLRRFSELKKRQEQAA